MKMNSRERVMAALRGEEPDQVPFCELAVDRALAAKLMQWEDGRTETAASLVKNPYTLAETLQIADRLGLDNITYAMRAPTYAHMEKGIDGRAFPGAGMIMNEADLAMIELPDPYDDELYAEAEEFVRRRGDYAIIFSTRSSVGGMMGRPSVHPRR